jgi:hypothetical protein
MYTVQHSLCLPLAPFFFCLTHFCCMVLAFPVSIILPGVRAHLHSTAAGGSEPTDSIRAVNALLTQLDKLKVSPCHTALGANVSSSSSTCTYLCSGTRAHISSNTFHSAVAAIFLLSSAAGVRECAGSYDVQHYGCHRFLPFLP